MFISKTFVGQKYLRVCKVESVSQAPMNNKVTLRSITLTHRLPTAVSLAPSGSVVRDSHY